MQKIDLTQIRSKITSMEIKYQSELAVKKSIEEEILATKKSIDTLEKQIEELEIIKMLYDKTSEYSREQAKIQIENLVSRCLSYIFEKEMNFKIEIKIKNNNPSAKFFIEESLDIDGEIKTFTYDIVDARGGGVVDIVSLALRISFIMLYENNLANIIVLDEPCKHVSEDYIHNVANFINEISEEYNKQIIMISHNAHLSAIGDINYRITNRNNTSEIDVI